MRGISYDEDMAAQNAVEDAKYDAMMGDGEDPPDDYLEQVAEERAEQHRDDAHGGGECVCPPPVIVFASEAPF